MNLVVPGEPGDDIIRHENRPGEKRMKQNETREKKKEKGREIQWGVYLIQSWPLISFTGRCCCRGLLMGGLA